MIHREILPLPEVNRREVLRYAGAKEEDPALTELLDAVLSELLPMLTGTVCWAEYPVTRRGDLLDLGFASTGSEALRRNLEGCGRIILFAATIGLGPDRLLARYGRVSPAKALLVQAVGAERIEALCDSFCDTLQKDLGCFLSPRFSPGYADLPLTLQTDVFRILDCQRKIGLTLNDSLLMSPSKSVTAIVGLRSCPGPRLSHDCSRCGNTDCAFRRMP